MSRERFSTVYDLFAAFPAAGREIGVAPMSESPLEFVAKLRASRRIAEAVGFCAYWLERRRAVWWACQNLRALQPAAADLDRHALDAAEAWVRQPEERLRAQAFEVARRAARPTPATSVAYAAAYCGPSVWLRSSGQAEAVAFVVDPGLAPGCVRGALMLAAGRLTPSAREDAFRLWLEEALRLAQIA